METIHPSPPPTPPQFREDDHDHEAFFIHFIVRILPQVSFVAPVAQIFPLLKIKQWFFLLSSLKRDTERSMGACSELCFHWEPSPLLSLQFCVCSVSKMHCGGRPITPVYTILCSFQSERHDRDEWPPKMETQLGYPLSILPFVEDQEPCGRMRAPFLR